VHLLRDECWELTTDPALLVGLISHGKSLPMLLQLALLQSVQTPEQPFTRREQGEQS
jgi:hypothetical protein